jgi:hypothetical protein
MDARIMPFIVLHHKKEGNEFITGYEGDYNRYSAYEILGFANTVEEAQKILHPTKEHRDQSLTNWMNKTFEDMEKKGLPMSEKGKELCLDIVLQARD